jgi:Uncharacterised nucleotidyltransferase
MSEAIKLWLTRAIVSDGLPDGPSDPGFSGEEWKVIQRSAGQHRLRPLLHTFASGPWRTWSIPSHLRSRWARSFQRSANRLVEHRAMLVEIAETLDALACRYAVLKGGLLVETVYPVPAARPIRDLDILVPRDQAEAAFAALIGQCGCVPVSQVTGVMLEDYSDHKHLEPLYCAARKVTIELHVSLADRPRGERARDVLFDTPTLLDRAQLREVGGKPVRFLAWPETLLHLLAHGVHDHQLNSGPLLLCDTLAVIRRAPLDWDEFWHFAHRGEWTAAARLTFDLVNEYAVPSPQIDLVPSGLPMTPPAVRTAAVLLMLQDSEREAAVGAWSRLHAGTSLREVLALVRRRWRSHRRAAKLSPSGTAGRGGRFAMARAMVTALLHGSERREIARSKAVYAWLNRSGS